MNKLYYGDNLAVLRNRISSAICIEIVSLVIIITEGSISIIAGISAKSISLIAFGADSLIELITSAFLLWRFTVQYRDQSNEDIEKAEKIASWVAAIALTILCLYIILESGYGLIHQENEFSFSVLGITVSAFALLSMPILALRKRRIAIALNSPALKADAACSMTCAYMAGAVLIGFVIYHFFKISWIDSAVSIAFLYWLIPETKEAFEGARKGELSCECE